MAGPIEILIVAGVFGVIGIYLYVVYRFIKSSEEPPARHEPREVLPDRNDRTPRASKQVAAVF